MEQAQSDFERYVERYAKQNGISKEEAQDHLVVQEVKRSYFTGENKADG